MLIVKQVVFYQINVRDGVGNEAEMAVEESSVWPCSSRFFKPIFRYRTRQYFPFPRGKQLIRSVLH